MSKDLRSKQRRGGGEASVLATRVSAVTAMVLSLLVMVGTVIMVLPAGTPMKKELQSVASPYFSQTWRVFAPNIMKANFSLEMRAQWFDDDVMVKSDWVSITDLETKVVPGNVIPSRIQKSSWNLSQTFRKRFNALDDEQKTRVKDTFIQRGEEGFEAIPSEELIAELGKNDANVIRFLRMDYMTMRYLSFYARAGFGKDIERVQWRIVLDRPNDFTHRFDDEKQFKPTVTTFGWRQSNVRAPKVVVDEYRAVIHRMGAERLFKEAAANGQ
ncbi:DUF5819 family protein [Leucobacter chinensis]|uniref:DUF5819 family protein n=1 Tax=Leucobacter chinensis TaxID=2851010 RepID=UPI001C220ABB|nr:DUF5819 family protein [Leucobacter chinensis]